MKFSQIELTSGEIQPSPEQAPDFAATLAAEPGTQAGTTKLTGATADAGNRLVVQVSSVSIGRPNVGDLLPTGAGLIDPYTIGSDIANVDGTTNKYVALYEVDGTGKIVKFSQIELTSNEIQPTPGQAPDFAATLAAEPGTQAGTTKLTGVTADAGNRLVVQVSSVSIRRPNVGDLVPTGAGLIDPYTIGSDIANVDGTTNKYVALYEADGTGKIVKFREITLTSGNIASASPSGGNNSGTSPSGGGSNSGASPSDISQPGTSVIVLVNGKEENAGTATASKRNNQTVTRISIDQKKLDAKLASEGKDTVITIPVSAKSDIIIGELNGQMVKNMEGKQAVVKIQTDNATYTLPAQQINIGAISDKIGKSVALQDIKVQIEIAASTADIVKIVENAAEKGAFTLVVPSVDFTVKAVYGDRTVDVSMFTAFVERTIAIPDGIDPNKITTGVVVEPDSTVRHVPTKITLIDGKYHAVINSLTNSTYSVVWHPVEYSDVATHWAKTAVNDMGSRMVVEGTGSGQFSPDRDITRAEYAAIIVRGLGLKPENGSTAFTDVKATDWYSSAIHTAHAYGLIDGYHDGMFRPNDKITREQAMAILAKAMKLTRLQDKLIAQSAEETLHAFEDAAAVAAWAKNGVANAVQAGIVSGRSADTLVPKGYMTRAEVAAMIQRLLQKSGLI